MASAGLCLLAAQGCGMTEPIACTAEFVYGISVQVRDSVSGAPVTEDLEGQLTAPRYAETMEAWGNVLVGAGERPGTYTVVVAATGYEEWRREGVRVEAGRCHVTPVSMDADLTPQPSA